jgi:hypothetical protein
VCFTRHTFLAHAFFLNPNSTTYEVAEFTQNVDRRFVSNTVGMGTRQIGAERNPSFQRRKTLRAFRAVNWYSAGHWGSCRGKMTG